MELEVVLAVVGIVEDGKIGKRSAIDHLFRYISHHLVDRPPE